MSSTSPTKARSRTGSMKISTDAMEDHGHHLVDPFLPQTPFDSQSTPISTRSNSPSNSKIMSGNGVICNVAYKRGLWHDIKTMRWAVVPSSALKLLFVPIVLYVNWEILAPYVAPGIANPFAPFLFISHRVPTSSDDDQRYQKGYLDMLFIGYHIVFYSFVRQIITQTLCRPLARYFGIKKQAKQDRFGEQGYALIYFSLVGVWGFIIMSKLPTWWYRTEYFWIDYPHWDMNPQLKRYYLMHSAYWCQQLIVLLLGLEKPRKDYAELVAHHFVTLWLIGWSYLINLTLIGNAVYMSMDIPDAFLALSKLFNYIQWERFKVASFAIFIVVWTYFRHWLNLVILYSVQTEFDLIPQEAKQWYPSDGVWLAWWMKYQILFPIAALQVLNLFWYWLIMRILVRTIVARQTTDERSDDEGDEDVEKED